MRGDLVIQLGDGARERLQRAALCRCGQSNNKPFCDNSHLQAGFQAAGATPAQVVSNIERSANAGIPT
jgi:CDGSH-type Zn-finger protein